MTNEITFYMRRVHEGKLKWEPISVTQEELLKRTKFHQDSSIDICLISVQDLMTSRFSKGEDYLRWHSVSTKTLSGKNNIHMEVADDILVIGYPHSYYDRVNLFPIVKSGIIASRWGTDFDGEPYFLIDAKLFPGSSGSIVVSKPTNMVVDGNNVYTSKEKQFAFLGIYSGEPDLRHPNSQKELDVNVGIVWYGHLVDEIIENGVAYQAKG
jgi:hypothetical protein